MVSKLHQLRRWLGSILQCGTAGIYRNWSSEASRNTPHIIHLLERNWMLGFTKSTFLLRRRLSAERPACGASSSTPSVLSPGRGRELRRWPNVSGPTWKSTAPKLPPHASKNIGKSPCFRIHIVRFVNNSACLFSRKWQLIAVGCCVADSTSTQSTVSISVTLNGIEWMSGWIDPHLGREGDSWKGLFSFDQGSESRFALYCRSWTSVPQFLARLFWTDESWFMIKSTITGRFVFCTYH